MGKLISSCTNERANAGKLCHLSLTRTALFTAPSPTPLNITLITTPTTPPPPGLLYVTCSLHGLNLQLSSAFFAAFGDDTSWTAVFSAARLIYMVPYMTAHYSTEFVSTAII
jgi:hypothetical protein